MKKPLDPYRPRRWQSILRRIPEGTVLTGAEIGVYAGATSIELLTARPMITHIMVDPWEPFHEVDARDRPTRLSTLMDTPEKTEAIYQDVLEKMRPFGERAIVMRLRSTAAASQIGDWTLDYVFIDAVHTYDSCKHDIELWLPKVRPGGWIGGHDYDNLPRFPGIKKAVLEAFPDGIEIDGDHTWFKRIS